MSEQRFERLLASAIVKQYDDSSVDRFLQLDPSRRALFVDDFHKAQLTVKQESAFIAQSQNRFGHIVIGVSDLYRMRELRKEDPFLNFHHCDIKRFGHRLRGRLIYKWMSIAVDNAQEEATLSHDVPVVEKILTTLLGKNVVPPYPLNILSLLQMIESSQPHVTMEGSYGELYEMLIKASLGGSSGDLKQAEQQTTYLSFIAYAMFEADRRSLPESELRRINQEYATRFEYMPAFPAILSELVTSQALQRENGEYMFRYTHYYYYFAAKYFERVLRRTSPEGGRLKEQLRSMADRLHNEELANIVLFYVYLSQDWDLISYIVSNADKVYASRPVSDLERDVAFVNRIHTTPAQLALQDTNVDKRRDDYRKRMDEADEEKERATDLISLDDKITYSETLADLHKVNIAIKTLQVLGQVLRSSADTLEGDQRLTITSACYGLGLRTMTALLGIAENNVDELRTYFAALIKERIALEDAPPMADRELARKTQEGIIWLTHQCAYGTLKKVAYAVGHRHLEETYNRIEEQNPDNLAIGLVGLTIKLEHLRLVPEYDIKRLRDKVVGNPFGYWLLRQIIGDFLYLYRVDVRTSQRLGSWFKIEGVTSAKYLLPDNKTG